MTEKTHLINRSKKQERGEKEREKKYIMVIKNLQTLEKNQHHDKIKHSKEELQPNIAKKNYNQSVEDTKTSQDFSGKDSACQCTRHRFFPWSGKNHVPWSMPMDHSC